LDSSTWSRPVIATGFSDPDLLACFTPQTRAAAAQLAEEPVENFPVPTGTLVINVFPQEGEWMPQGMHIDHAIKNHDHSVFPRPLRVASITYLNDVQPQSGGTCVWPGSHRIIEQLAKSDPVLYEKMWKLNENLSSLNLGEPLELLGKQGDVLFYHYLTAHSGSTNIGTYPRLALVYKW
jgi:ectoine hydroxylase-related dioxygenase (phytanoyl-CoA dioxygenase family)